MRSVFRPGDGGSLVISNKRAIRGTPLAALALTIPGSLALFGRSEAVTEKSPVDVYQQSVLPILEKHCYECHGDGYDKGKEEEADKAAVQLLVETGFVRERSMSGIALKTFLMLLASSLAYSVIGYKIMYGSDIFHGLIGWDPSAHDLGMEWQFYQTGFAAVAATIISGAIAERTTLTINIIIALVIGGLIYPVAGHWAWATDGWLHSMGFHDLAGSGVVHFLGGIASATAAWIAGPRLDKYNPATKRIRGYVGERSLPLVSCALDLWGAPAQPQDTRVMIIASS